MRLTRVMMQVYVADVPVIERLKLLQSFDQKYKVQGDAKTPRNVNALQSMYVHADDDQFIKD